MTEPDQQKVMKEVTVVAYAKDEDSNIPLRQWAEKVTGIDVTSYQMEVSKDFSLVFTTESGYTFNNSINIFSSRYEDVERAKKELEKKGIESVEIEVNENKDKLYNHSPIWAANQLREHIYRLLPDELSGNLLKDQTVGTNWHDPDEDWSVRMWSSKFKEMRLLSKEAKRENDDLYETMAERPCFKFTVKMTAPDQGHIDEWTDEVIPEVTKLLSSHPHLGKVRFMNCTTRKEQSGECYNI